MHFPFVSDVGYDINIAPRAVADNAHKPPSCTPPSIKTHPICVCLYTSKQAEYTVNPTLPRTREMRNPILAQKGPAKKPNTAKVL